MRAIAVAALVVLALSGCGSGSSDSTSETSLTITYWENGSSAGSGTKWTLRCDPARGTLTRPEPACQRLEQFGTRPFAPVGGGVACPQVFGGPEEARVVGSVDGERVRATFARNDGCQIMRWRGVSPWLLPQGGVTG